MVEPEVSYQSFPEGSGLGRRALAGVWASIPLELVAVPLTCRPEELLI